MMTDKKLVERLRDLGMHSAVVGADRIEALTAERDRMREALQQFLIEYDEVDLAHSEPPSLTAAVLSARATLKGESHE